MHYRLDKARFKLLFHFVSILELEVFTEGICISIFITPSIRKYCQQNEKNVFRNPKNTQDMQIDTAQ